MVDAKGNSVQITQESELDLLYAIRGAGQFFGLITEITIRIWPLAELSNIKGAIWNRHFVPLERAREMARAIEGIMENSTNATAGLFIIICLLPAREPAVVIAGKYISDPDDAPSALSALYALNPLSADSGSVPIQNISDGREMLEAKGGFKTFGTVGLRRFNIERFLETIDVWKLLIKDCPDAINTTYNFQWDSRPPR